MSQKERQRHLVLDRVVKKELRLSEAVRIMGVTYRHGHRLLTGYRTSGEASLVHGLRGRLGTRCLQQDLKDSVLASYRSRYSDFGPTLASEKLSQNEELEVHPETLRLWLIESGDWQPRKRRLRHRSKRKRRASFGELVQVDGSHHDWFEGRGVKCCLMTFVDDATGKAFMLFTENEGTFAVMATLLGWIGEYGIPRQLYTDRLQTYLTDREPTMLEQLAGEEPKTQFGRACGQLGISIMAAHSPQAKGRVENKHKLSQDRLVKELRLAGINDIAAANAFLPKWLAEINERFVQPARSEVNFHRAVPAGTDLRAIFCRQETRVVGADWIVSYQNRLLQVHKQKDLPRSGSVVTVREWQDGSLQVVYNDHKLAFAELACRPVKVKPPRVVRAKTAPVPAAEHPWRSGNRPLQASNPRRDYVEAVTDHYLGEASITGVSGACMRNVTAGGDL